jgi:ABC-type transport system substrate-binding protein
LGTNFPVFSRLRDQFPREYVTGGAGYTTYFYWVDHESPPMDDQRLRQAMALAVNRDALARAWGQTAPAYGGLVPPGIPGHLRGIAAERDPDRAARLITDLVGDDTPPIAVIGFDFAEPFVQQLVNDWRAVGLPVEMQLCATAFDQSVAWRTTAGPKVAVHGWLADYPDPDTFLRVAVEGFAPGWRPAGYGSLLERAARTSDLASRLQLYREAEEILAEEAVLVPLLYHPDVLMLKPWVTKFPTVPFLYYAGSFKDVVIGTQEA